MLTNEIRRLIRNIVEASKEAGIEEAEIKEAISIAFLGDKNVSVESSEDVLTENLRIEEKIQQFVECEENSFQSAELFASHEMSVRFATYVLLIYYNMSQNNVRVDYQTFVGIVAKTFEMSKQATARKIHSISKWLVDYIWRTYEEFDWDVFPPYRHSPSKIILASFYKDYMKKW